MAGRPKDPTINEKIFKEIDRLLETTYFRDMTIDRISENTGVSKATIYRRWKINHLLLSICLSVESTFLKMIIKRCTMNCIIF